jgi:ATP-dependent Clp protease ATP-binding subunit ClpA
MFERFTRRARVVVTNAVEGARDAGAGEVRPEHVLEAILAERNGVAVAVLTELGAPPDEMRAALQRSRSRRPGDLDEDDAEALKVLGIDLDEVVRRIERDLGGGTRPRRGHLPFTKGCKKSLELSLREALRLGDGFIGTEHLLLGLVRSGDPVVHETLAAFDIEPDTLRAAVAATERRRTG